MPEPRIEDSYGQYRRDADLLETRRRVLAEMGLDENADPIQTGAPAASGEEPITETPGAEDDDTGFFKGAVLGGARDAFVEAGQSIESMGDWLRDKIDFLPKGKIQIRIPEVDQPKGTVNQMARGVAQFLTGFIPGMKVTKLAGVKGAIKTPAIAGALADLTVFDPQSPRVSNLINELAPSLKNPLTEYLAADPSDSEAEGRFKNALEGAGLGLAAEGIFRAARLMRSSNNVRRAEKSFEKAKKTGQKTGRMGEAFAKGEGDVTIDPKQKPITAGPDPLEAVSKSTIDVGDKQLKVDWSEIGDPVQIDSIVKKLTKLNEEAVDIARRGVQSDDRTQELANMMGLTADDILQRRSGQALNAEETKAYIDLYGSAANRLDELARKVKDSRLTGQTAPELEKEFRRHLGVTTAITEQVFGARAEAGRALRMWGSVAEDVPFKMGELSRGAEMLTAGRTMADVPVDRLADMIVALDTPAKKATFLRGLSGNGLDAIIEVWINGLLTNPVTHVVNAASNTLVSMLGVSERALAEGGRSLASKFGLTKEVDGIVRGETSAMIHGMTEGFKDGIRLAWQALMKGEGGLGFTKLDTPKKAISKEAFNLSGTPGQAVDLLGEFVRLPGRFLVAGDEFFKSINYRSELHALSWREAVRDGGTQKEMAKRMRQILIDPPAQVKRMAENFAHYQTFTRDLVKGQDVFSTLGALTLEGVSKHPMGRVIFPFVRTPTNIFKYTLERTPLANLALKQVRADFKAGGARRDLVIAKTSMGAMVMSVGAYLAASGKITGGGPANDQLKRIKKQTGWQPYSILIGNKWVSFSRLDPIGSMLGAVANYMEIVGSLDEASADAMAMALVMSFKETFLDKTYMTGLANVVKAIDDPDRFGQAWIKRTAGSLVPAGVAHIERQMDPIMREVNSTMDQIRSRLPNYSESLPPSRNIWGEPILMEGGIGPDIITPFYSSTVKDDPVAEELVRLELPIGMPAKSIEGRTPSKSPLAKRRGDEGVPLSPEEYDRYVVLAGNEFKIGGLGMKDRLEQAIESPTYKNQSDDGKELEIRTIVHAYREGAKGQLMREFPHLREMAVEVHRRRGEALRPTGNIGIEP